MFTSYMKTLLNKINRLDKKATNPFLKGEFDPHKCLMEQTYIWVEKQKDEKEENRF